MYHTVTETYKYHYVSTNNLLFEKAVVITNRQGISDLMNHIISLDLATNFYLKKPSSGWVLAGLTNITNIITEMRRVPIGSSVDLPDYTGKQEKRTKIKTVPFTALVFINERK